MSDRSSTLASCGEGTVVEAGAVIICPEAVHLGRNATVAVLACLVGSHEGELRVGDGTLIGPHSYVQGLGGVRIGDRVGIGAGVLMLTAAPSCEASTRPAPSSPACPRARCGCAARAIGRPASTPSRPIGSARDDGLARLPASGR
jgi:hypothetical protein